MNILPLFRVRVPRMREFVTDAKMFFLQIGFNIIVKVNSGHCSICIILCIIFPICIFFKVGIIMFSVFYYTILDPD